MKHEQALALSPLTQGPPGNFAGHWENELISTMDLTITGSNVTGNYTSTVSGTGQTISGPIIGVVSGQVISFIVNWPNASITAWVGHLVKEGSDEVLETLWNLAMSMPNPNDPNELWESVFAGADRFHR
jgi:hypothetical protein